MRANCHFHSMRDVDINGGTRDDGDGTNVRVKSGMKNSRSEFDEYFREGGESTGKPDGFQDLWNNYYGRFYINNGYGSNYNAAYEAAVASGIVETGNTISTQKINTIYGNQSWWLV